MNIIPRFSFTYNGEPFDLAGAKTTPTEYGSLYELPDGLGIELHRRDYPEYNAVGWMLWFENKSANESGLIKGSQLQIESKKKTLFRGLFFYTRKTLIKSNLERKRRKSL